MSFRQAAFRTGLLLGARILFDNSAIPTITGLKRALQGTVERILAGLGSEVHG